MRKFSPVFQSATALLLISSGAVDVHATPTQSSSTPAHHVAVKTPVKTVSTSAAPTASTAQAVAPNPYGLNPQEVQFINLVNHERSTRGLSILTIDPDLIQIARSHSQEMWKLDYFDHHSPTAGIATPMDRYLKQVKDTNQPTPAYVLVGENIYYCSILDDHYNVDYGHQSLMNSPGHRANILEPRFTKIGVGTYRDDKGEFWVTESFLCDVDPHTDSTPAATASN